MEESGLSVSRAASANQNARNNTSANQSVRNNTTLIILTGTPLVHVDGQSDVLEEPEETTVTRAASANRNVRNNISANQNVRNNTTLITLSILTGTYLVHVDRLGDVLEAPEEMAIAHNQPKTELTWTLPFAGRRTC